MISTESQAKYLACRLTRQSRFGEMEKLIPVYLKSGIEVYPHQIAAAYFAVSNPFSKGFILCDEVGLGKAIEAMLVIAQYYYSGRNKIAVIVPPLLIPQWQRLISDKFDLPCKVIEKDFRSEINDEIVLISYTQAAEECESLSKIKWDLAVFEEAHRLIYLYYQDDKCVGKVKLRKNWNRYAYIEDIAVCKDFRGQGIGSALINISIEWAKHKNLHGLMLETQDNNLIACKFYHNCGFKIGSVDTMLYANFENNFEKAVFWYLRF